MKKIATTLFGFLFLFTAFISAQDIITWDFSLEDAGNGEVNIIAKASVQQGWYMYDTKIPDGGPNPTMIEFDKTTGAEAVGEFQSVDKKATVKHDEIFGMEIGTFTGSTTFAQRLKITDKVGFSIEGNVRAQACNDQTCTPPLPVDFSFAASDLPASVTVAGNTSTGESTLLSTPAETEVPADTTEETIAPDTPVSLTSTDREQLWSPVIEELNALGADDHADASLWSIFLKGLLWGFAALITPCVWPMIPITVSFFLNRNKKSRRKAIQDATIYGLSIIIIYVTLGLIITAIFGAAALNNIATSPVFNLIFFALLITFAFSFMGAFEIVLPSSWTNKMDSKVDSTTGIISLFFMAFTLALVSFSCTGPIIGWLLVDAATQGNFLAPALGMFGFAFALAIPFTLFAIFPSWLKTLPKSGSWLNAVKVVLGFIVLAVSLKFLSVADLSGGWGILNRDIFLSLWIVIFALLGLYLLGKIKLHGDSDLSHVPLFRLFLAILSFAFTIYLVPGLWGAPLKPISSIVPPLSTQDFKLAHNPMNQVFDDYETGMAYAAQTGKPVLLEFGGHGCVNCHKMDATVLADDRVRELIDEEFVFIVLMVDERTRLPETIEVDENGRTSKLRTVGDKWSYLQRHKFGTQSQPFYVVLNHQGKPLSPSHAYDESVDNYVEFLQTGLKNFRK
ncbi:Thiol:disulfide interchange protein [Proteiniphilum saccharofermentans]|uniref:Thiol:disulfide interchange protein n=1 Tax=Proteiniphilum saccharofermentans TaxID=1642647 RepID=A0A1R3T5W2_9BACT|nr:cytochrome c biogenesis protein CcdA [Proteiniphilum saccharofermentans]SCD21602.1 Thiol:disulfide interchange protein [Proteiniphilum saccharofermentans]